MGGSSAYRYRPFGCFRLGLAFLVVLQHFVANAAPLGSLYDYVLPYEVGSLAVLVFFCLSGFVITEAVTLIYSGRPVAYLANRFLRIVPHFLVALVIAVVLHAVFQHFGTLRVSDREHPDLPNLAVFGVRNIVGNIFGFLPGIKRFLLFDFVDIIWAVRIEMIFYFAVFFALLVPSRLRMSALLPYGLIGLGIATVVIARQFGFGFFFLFGVLLYNHRRYPVSLILCMVGMTLYFFLIPLQVDAGYHRAVIAQYIILVALIAAMTWLALKPSDRNAFDQRCGELSYPLYIHHQNMLILAISLTSGYSYPVFATGIVLSLVAAYALMRLVDPAVNRMRNAIRGGRLDRRQNQAQRADTLPAASSTRPLTSRGS